MFIAISTKAEQPFYECSLDNLFTLYINENPPLPQYTGYFFMPSLR